MLEICKKNLMKISCSYQISNCYRQKLKSSRYSRSSTQWIINVLLLFVLNEQFHSVLSYEFSLGYEAETYMSAVINLTYVDPTSGVLTHEHLQIGKLLPGENEQVSGIVVHVTSNNHTRHGACSKLDTDALPNESFIALIKYGNCRNEVKLRHAADGNAAAAVLYSDDHSTRFIQVERKANPITFAVINKQEGEWLADLVDNGTQVMMQISVSPVGTFQIGQISRTSVLLVSIAFLILIMVSFAWLIFYYIQRFRFIHAKEILSRHICSAARKALDKIPVRTVKTDNKGHTEEYECCAVCIEPFHHGDLIRTLPCEHCFHKICIDPWLLEQRSCPMCKLDILMHFGLVYSGSQESVLELGNENFRSPRASLVEQDFVLVQDQRRRSSVRIAIPRECTTSPCSLSSMDPDTFAEQSCIISAAIDVTIDVPISTSDPPSEVDDESSEESWIPPFPDKGAVNYNAMHPKRGSSSSDTNDVVKKTALGNFEVCDVSFEN